MPRHRLSGTSPCWRFSSGFLCLDRDGIASAEDGSHSTRIYNSGMLVSLPSGGCETLENMGPVAVLGGSGFEITLVCVADYRSSYVHW